jgi:putative hydrolase of the HAD superfamily
MQNKNHLSLIIWIVALIAIGGAMGSYFQECFASYKIGFIKPEQGFFQHIQKALSLLPHELLLIDDTKNNTIGAQDCGWHVYHYQNDTRGLMDFLKKYEVA